LTLALDEGEWSSSRPGRFTARGRAPVTDYKVIIAELFNKFPDFIAPEITSLN